MNTAELTTLHAETLNEARLERTLANIARRAETLFDNGYSAIQDDPHFYTVLTPQEGRYTVHINDANPTDETFGNWCTCPAHESYGTCKHLQAILLQRAADAALLAGYEARQDNDDDQFPEL